MNFNTIPEALQDLKQGKIILVTDDPDRENEGDFICAAEFATTENINFMATHGKGLICMPMSEAFVQKLQFPQMVQHNTDNHETAFTVSIDHVSTSTGISAAERSITAMCCVSLHFMDCMADVDGYLKDTVVELVDYLENSGAVRSEAGKVMAAKLKGKAASEFMKMNRRYDKICAAKGHFS